MKEPEAVIPSLAATGCSLPIPAIDPVISSYADDFDGDSFGTSESSVCGPGMVRNVPILISSVTVAAPLQLIPNWRGPTLSTEWIPSPGLGASKKLTFVAPGPAGPVAPVAPVGPIAPVAPAGPARPAAPRGPRGPTLDGFFFAFDFDFDT